MSEPVLIKIDRNGSKHFEGRVKCDRCGGDGMYKWGAVINGAPQYVGVCFKCDGAGWVIDRWIERTPEYQAKLDARREAKREAERTEREAKWQAERKAWEEENARREAERKAREEAEAAKRAASQYVGKVGEKLELSCVYVGSPSFERKVYGGYGTETCYVHTFDADGSKIVWKTASGLQLDEGQAVKIKAVVSDHAEYKGEKQTSVKRLKVAV